MVPRGALCTLDAQVGLLVSQNLAYCFATFALLGSWQLGGERRQVYIETITGTKKKTTHKCASEAAKHDK